MKKQETPDPEYPTAQRLRDEADYKEGFEAGASASQMEYDLVHENDDEFQIFSRYNSGFEAGWKSQTRKQELDTLRNTSKQKSKNKERS